MLTPSAPLFLRHKKASKMQQPPTSRKVHDCYFSLFEDYSLLQQLQYPRESFSSYDRGEGNSAPCSLLISWYPSCHSKKIHED